LKRGMKELVMIRLCHGQQIFGVWMLFFDHYKRLNQKKMYLLESLANQLGIALSNIRANEELNWKEKEIILESNFSSATSSIKDAAVLSSVLKVQLKKLFCIRNFAVYKP